MRVVLDTNIWISTFIGKRLVGLAEVLKQGQLEPLTAESQMSELFQVLDRPKLATYFSYEDKQFIQRFFLRACTLVTISRQVTVCRDPKDDFLLEIAVNGDANLLVTGDQDLLVLNQFEATKIVSFREFEDSWGLGR